MADGSPPAEVAILTDSDILQKELSVMTVTSKRWMERFVMNPQVLCFDGSTSDYDPEDRCSNVDGEEGVFQDPISEVVSVRPEVAEKWMDRFVIDLVESPSVFRESAVARTFGPAMYEEYSPVVFAGGGGRGVVADAYPLDQTCDEESGDADFDPFKMAPWDAGGTPRDEVHETMCRAMVHDIDRSTTEITECIFTTNMLLATNCPRLQMTPGEDDASHRGTRIGGDVHDTVAISDGHPGSKDVDIFRRSAVCVEVDIPADMDCTVVEMSDVTILRRRSPQGQDSAELQERCIGISKTAVEFNDGVFRLLRLPRTELFVVPRTHILYLVNRRIGLFAGRNHRGGLLSRNKT